MDTTISAEGLKVCTRCEEPKLLEAFHRHAAADQGRDPVCKECWKEWRALAKSGLRRCRECRKIQEIAAFRMIGSKRSSFCSTCLPEEMRRCGMCRGVKLKSEFSRHRGVHDGLDNKCKQCSQKAQGEYNRRYPGRLAILQREGHLRRVERGYKFPHKPTAEQRRAYDNSRRARLDATPGFAGEHWSAMCEFYENTCLCCGKECALAVDHVVPLSKGGPNTIENIQPLCKSCNSRKHAKTIDYRDSVLHEVFMSAVELEGM